MRTPRLLILAALPCMAASCAAARVPAREAASEAKPRVEMRVTYRDAANVFEILDNVSNWLPDKCDVEYRDHWKQRFGITPDDEARFASYKEIRERYYAGEPDQEIALSLLGKAKPPDRIAAAFYGAADLAAAFSRVAEFVRPEDVAALRSFYDAFRPRYEALLAESKAYPEIAAAFQAKLDGGGAASFCQSVADFYGVGDLPRFTALYIWWPPVDHMTANNRGSFVLLKYHPIRHREDALRAVEIPVHEFTHYVSAHQPEEQKRALTKVFLAGCDVGSMTGPRVLEEPLAVAHQKLFLSRHDPGRLEFTSSWYGGDPWVGVLAKLIYPQVQKAHESGRKLDETLMAGVGKACRQLRAVAASLPK